MERLKKIVDALRKRPRPATEQEILNVAREYLQVLILKLIYRSKFGAALSFMGGTCLRICYDLKRYSEDLDFALDDSKARYDFSELVALLAKELSLLGFDVSSNAHDEKVVQKAFLGFSGLPEILSLKSMRTEQKLHVKIETDVQPVPIEKNERESFFVNRFQEIFPVLKHDLPTLFAGKVLAILGRPYDRGRDYYDLIWYLSQRCPLNLAYLNRAPRYRDKPFQDLAAVHEALRRKMVQVKPAVILKDIGRFLEDPKEADWIKKYSELFESLVAERPLTPVHS